MFFFVNLFSHFQFSNCFESRGKASDCFSVAFHFYPHHEKIIACF